MTTEQSTYLSNLSMTLKKLDKTLGDKIDRAKLTKNERYYLNQVRDSLAIESLALYKMTQVP